MNTTTKLKLESQGKIALRKIAKRKLEKYRKAQKKFGKKMEVSFVQELREFGREEARYYHVAYSLLKGNQYRDIERSACIPINPQKLLNILKSFEYGWTIDKVQDLLKD